MLLLLSWFTLVGLDLSWPRIRDCRRQSRLIDGQPELDGSDASLPLRTFALRPFGPAAAVNKNLDASFPQGLVTQQLSRSDRSQ